MKRRGIGTRQAALRRAREVKMARDAARLERESRIEQVLAEFFHNTSLAQQIREQAQARAAKVLTDAQIAMREPEYVARLAVRALLELGETRRSVTELTGLSAGQVRDALADDGAPVTSEIPDEP